MTVTYHSLQEVSNFLKSNRLRYAYTTDSITSSDELMVYKNIETGTIARVLDTGGSYVVEVIESTR